MHSRPPRPNRVFAEPLQQGIPPQPAVRRNDDPLPTLPCTNCQAPTQYPQGRNISLCAVSQGTAAALVRSSHGMALSHSPCVLLPATRTQCNSPALDLKSKRPTVADKLSSCVMHCSRFLLSQCKHRQANTSTRTHQPLDGRMPAPIVVDVQKSPACPSHHLRMSCCQLHCHTGSTALTNQPRTDLMLPVERQQTATRAAADTLPACAPKPRLNAHMQHGRARQRWLPGQQHPNSSRDHWVRMTRTTSTGSAEHRPYTARPRNKPERSAVYGTTCGTP